jgi:hypothetical protein
VAGLDGGGPSTPPLSEMLDIRCSRCRLGAGGLGAAAATVARLRTAL